MGILSQHQRREEHDGKLSKGIEHQAAKLPAESFLWASLATIAASAALQAMGKKETSHFIGQWAPTFLLFGLYNKLAKMARSMEIED